MRLRLLGLLAALVACALGLAACNSKAGAAAVVNGERIPTATLDTYVVNGPPPVSGSASPRSIALQYLLREKILERALTVGGGLPSDSDLAKHHDTALSNELQTQVSGAAADAALRKAASQLGLTPKFDELLTRTVELESEFSARVQANTIDQNSVLKVLREPVSVSPRFGVWNASQLALSAPQPPAFAKIPNFTDLMKSAAPASSPTASS